MNRSDVSPRTYRLIRKTPGQIGVAGFAISAMFGGSAWSQSAPGSNLAAPTPATPEEQKLQSVEVTGSTAKSSLDVPQSIDTISQREITEQHLTRLTDALRNVPGITLNAGEGGAHGDSVNLRGLSVPDSFFLDGLRDIGQYGRDTFNQQSISVLLGPSSILFGRGSTAGVINSVTKQPELETEGDVTFSVGSAGLIRGTSDVNYQFDDTSAFRLNAMDEHSGVEERNNVFNRRTGIAPSLAFGIGTDTRININVLHQSEDNVPDYGIPFIDGAPAQVDRSNFYGLGNYDRSSTDTNIATLRVEHDFNDAVTLSNTLRVARYDFAYLLSAPHLDNDFTEVPPPGTPLSQILDYRDQPSSGGSISSYINRTDVTSTFNTGSLTHSLVTGIELSREVSDITRYFNGIDVLPPTPLLNPNPYNALATPLTAVSLPHSEGSDVSAYAIDRIGLTEHWDIDAGLRYDRFNSYFSDALAGTSFSRADSEVSPRAALVFKPDKRSSYYVSYGTSYNPAIEYLVLAPSDDSLTPEKDKTVEIGTKWLLANNKIVATADVFQSKLTNARIADPDDPTIQQMPFDQRVRGLELGISGYLTEQLELIAGYTHLNDKITSSTDPLSVDRDAPNTPHDSLNFWATYKFMPKWQFGSGVNFTGHRYADTENTAGVPSYTVFNEMLAYQVTKDFGLQLNLNNITNKLYFAGIYYSGVDENHAVPAPGRTVILTAALHF